MQKRGYRTASEGGTISVSAGTYSEAIYINKKIALMGSGISTITTQGLGDTNTVKFDETLTDNALISGFMITQETYEIHCRNGSSKITGHFLKKFRYIYNNRTSVKEGKKDGEKMTDIELNL